MGGDGRDGTDVQEHGSGRGGGEVEEQQDEEEYGRRHKVWLHHESD